ncbi:hypothetical protein HMPREF9071_2078 [Capnocytophaga sp. oral taxon 338 str. F0234]|nr:hypothetical protein HMPREF9071_2078 [Capnocytophaga sp. oral taxon 338 str. F0234]
MFFEFKKEKKKIIINHWALIIILYFCTTVFRKIYAKALNTYHQ